MKPQDMMKVILSVLFFISSASAATIGDGRTSLITGRAIDVTSTRGRCYVDGQYYSSETSIPRDHPCHYCLCYQSKVDCYWKNCGPPPTGCEPLLFEGVCSPSLYLCSIPETARAAPDYRLNEFGARFKRHLVGSKRKLPVEDDNFDAHLVKQLDERRRKKRSVGRLAGSHHHEDHHDHHNHDHFADRGCTILGVKYQLGELIGVATDVCMECRCAAQEMYCSPKCCFEPVGIDAGLSRSDSGSDRPVVPHPLYYVRTEFDYDV